MRNVIDKKNNLQREHDWIDLSSMMTANIDIFNFLNFCLDF